MFFPAARLVHPPNTLLDFPPPPADQVNITMILHITIMNKMSMIQCDDQMMMISKNLQSELSEESVGQLSEENKENSVKQVESSS